MSVSVTNGVDKNVVDLYGNPFYTALAQAVETLRHAPYWHEGEKAPSRLDRARELVRNSRVLLQDERLATVYGSTKLYDVTGFHCTCPQSQKGQSSWCVHSVSVKLARTLAEQGLGPRPPVELGTLRPGTLPLPPVTVEERLAQRPAEGVADRDAPGMETPPTRAQAERMPHAPCLIIHEPQEDRMSDDAALYMPTPTDTTTAVLEPPDTTAATPRPLPGPVLLPSLEPVKIPREYTVNIKGKTHVLYTGLVVAARTHGLTSLSADWTYNDAELSLAHAVCTFADGRRYEESGDATPGNVTKGISLHFRRVALTRAKARCLRDALGISECSVEELADTKVDDGEKSLVPDMTHQPTEKELRQRIWAIIKEQAPECGTRASVEAFIKERTGMDLHSDLYAAIVTRLTEVGR